jgi:hypothetical protein
MPVQEIDCRHTFAERVSRPSQVMINICHALGCYYVPEGDYDGTNLEGLSGKPLEQLRLSDLEKVGLDAAGFKRVPEYVRKKGGQLIQNDNGSWSLCREDGTVSLDETVHSLLEDGTNIIGIRIDPRQPNYKDTIPDRPFRKITRADHPALIRNEQGNIIGLHLAKLPDGSYNPESDYHFEPNDTIEIFIEPTADVVKGCPQAGGIRLQIKPNHGFEAEMTTCGVDIRQVHDPETENDGHYDSVKGALNQEVNHPIIRHLLDQDGAAIDKLRQAIYSIYPYAEIVIELHYAMVDDNWIVCAFDFETPEKIGAQWRSTPRKWLKGVKKFDEKWHISHINSIWNRYLFYLRQGD